MLYGKLRIHTCRVILLTSLVWFLVDVVVLSFYSECLGSACKKPEDLRPEAQALVENANNDYDQVEENNKVDVPDRYVHRYIFKINLPSDNQYINFDAF